MLKTANLSKNMLMLVNVAKDNEVGGSSKVIKICLIFKSPKILKNFQKSEIWSNLTF